MIIKKMNEINFDVLNESTWEFSKNRHKRVERGKKHIVKIEKLKQEISNDFGDDELFDELDSAIKRIEELMELPKDQIKESITIKKIL